MSPNNKSVALNGVREIFSLVFSFNLKGLFLTPTENGALQFFRYCFVGGIATIADWSVLYVAEHMGLYYLVAAAAGFICGLACNYVLSTRMVFNGSSAKIASAGKEFLAYAGIGVVGLVMTLALMFVLTDWAGLHFMVSKIISTVLVLIWNFLARKALYR